MAVHDYSKALNPEKALIWRIVHRDNMPWILKHGLHCGNSHIQSASWVHIGNPELIGKRANHPVPLGSGGTLNDYVPFYFTPFSPMLMNIKSGRGGVQQRDNDEIIILVSSLHRLQELQIPFIFTDKHAYYQWANFYDNLIHIDQIDWPILQAIDFKRDPNDPAKFERYQAEALAYGHCPVEALIGIMCYNNAVKSELETLLQSCNISLPIHSRPGVYL